MADLKKKEKSKSFPMGIDVLCNSGHQYTVDVMAYPAAQG